MAEVRQAALPPAIPATEPQVDVQPRCWRCGRMLTRFFFTRPWKIECPKCHAKVASEPA